MAAQGERGAYQKLEQGCQQRRMQRGMPSECLDTDTGWPLCVPSTSFSLSVPSHLFLPHPSSSLSLSLALYYSLCVYTYISVSFVPARRHNIDNWSRERSSRTVLLYLARYLREIVPPTSELRVLRV